MTTRTERDDKRKQVSATQRKNQERKKYPYLVFHKKKGEPACYRFRPCVTRNEARRVRDELEKWDREALVTKWVE